jgi:hypothetical protein
MKESRWEVYYYYALVYHRAVVEKKYFRRVKGGNRKVWNTKDPTLNVEHPISTIIRRVQPPGCTLNVIYSAHQLFIEHQLQPIMTKLSLTEAKER